MNKTKIFLIFLVLFIGLYLVSFADFGTDEKFVSFDAERNFFISNFNPQTAKNFQEDPASEPEATADENISDFLGIPEEEFPPVTGQNKNSAFCLNNKDPSTLTLEERIAEFKAGPCAPIIILPGIMATSLRVEITNCELFRQMNPVEFKNCGWTTCKSTIMSRVLRNVAPKEVHLWISISKIFSANPKTSKCFGGLSFLKLNPEVTDPKLRYTTIEGIRVTWQGNTPGTKKTSDCGIRAIKDYLGIKIRKINCEIGGFAVMTDYLKKQGYESGITLQAMPYDFRRAYIYNDLDFQLKRSLKFLNQVSGKKVILFAHSLGNLMALPFLNRLSQKEKDQMIHAYFSAGAPFVGATKALRCEIGGEPSFFFANVVGLRMHGQKGFLGGATGLFDAFPKDAFYRFAGEEWMKEFVRRIRDEKKYPDMTSEAVAYWEDKKRKGTIDLPWFPNPTDRCNDGNIKIRGIECKTHGINYQDAPIVKIGEEVYFAREEDLKLLSEKHIVTSENARQLYEDSLKTESNLLINPGVPVILLFGSFLETEYSVEYPWNVAGRTDANQLTKPKKINSEVGDGVILAASSITAGVKWVWEHKNKVPNAKAVKLLEYCSLYNNDHKVYDSTVTLNESGYIGRSCSCMKNAKFTRCKHACYVSEPGFLEILKEIITTGEVSKNAIVLEEAQLLASQSECYTLTLPEVNNDVVSFIQGNPPA